VTGGNVDQSTQTSTATSTNTETNTTTTTTTNTDSNNVTEYVTNEYVTTEGTNVSLEDIQALLANNLEVTVLIDGEAVEVEQCEDGGLTFGGDTCT
jgi:carbohydrate-binding DOMON domain-containing protein